MPRRGLWTRSFPTERSADSFPSRFNFPFPVDSKADLISCFLCPSERGTVIRVSQRTTLHGLELFLLDNSKAQDPPGRNTLALGRLLWKVSWALGVEGPDLFFKISPRKNPATTRSGPSQGFPAFQDPIQFLSQDHSLSIPLYPPDSGWTTGLQGGKPAP